MVRMKKRAPRRHRRRVVRKKRSSGSKLIEKVYTYNFTPNSQYLASNPAAGGLLTVQPVGSRTNGPLQLSQITGAGTTVLPASQTGFGNYFDCGVGQDYSLSTLQNFSNFVNLYDNYRINYITLTITYLANTASVGDNASTGTGMLPTVYWFVDHDDASIPLSIKNVTARPGHKSHNFGMRQSCKIRIVPRVANIVYNDNTAGATQPLGYSQLSNKAWIDCQTYTTPVTSFNAGVNYNGLKLWFTDLWLPAADDINSAFKFDWNFIISFKGVFN